MSNSPYTTNRILEIPQDIKLELNNGTLTLKAGSKVYAPNGFEQDGTTPKFDVVTIANDIVVSITSAASGIGVVTVRSSGTAAASWDSSICSTGTTDAGNNTLRYRSDTNLVVRTDNSGGKARHSFPIAILNQTGTTINSIDQIFNGFGYIGSTVFALPGIKVQIPNGRNEDGTCKSVYGVIRTVQQTSVNPGDGDFSIRIGDNFIAVGKFVYDGYTNYNYNQTVSPSNIRYQTNAGTVSYSSGKITSFEPYTVDSVANSNASNFSQAGRSYLSGLGMPSDTGYLVSNSFATSTKFTAPSNGYFRFRAAPTTANATFMVFLGNTDGNKLYSGGYYNGLGTGQVVNCFLPIKQGQSVNAQHNNANLAFDATSGLYFIPAEGEN